MISCMADFIKPHHKGNLGHSDLRKARDFVLTMEPLGFVLIKQVDDFLMRVLTSVTTDS